MKRTPLGRNVAEIELTNDVLILFSYQTPVACKVNGKYFRTKQFWSVTTSRHINKWLNGADCGEIEQTALDDLMEGKMGKQMFRLIVTKKAQGLRQELEGNDCHTIKSLAGTLFHVATVTSVCVADLTGFVWLYMSKDVPTERWVDVPSEVAEVMGLNSQ